MPGLIDALRERVTAALLGVNLNFETRLVPSDDPPGPPVRIWQFTMSGPLPLPEGMAAQALTVPVLIVASERMVFCWVAINSARPLDDILPVALQSVVEKVALARLLRTGDGPHPVWIRSEVPVEDSADHPVTKTAITAAWQSVVTAAHLLASSYPERFEFVRAEVLPVVDAVPLHPPPH